MKTLKFKKCALKNLTWLKSGGEAELFQPESVEDLCRFIKTNRGSIKKFFTLGAGSNILASNNIEKTIIRLGRKFNYIEYRKDPERIIAGAAALDTAVAKFALEQGIKGFEFLSVIPGTIGGGIAMNAGAYDDSISKILMRATVVDEYGELAELTNYELGFGYRQNVIPKSWVIIEAGFKIEREDPAIIKAKMVRMLQAKQDAQPTRTKTCGSIFKNPPGAKAWELIEKAGFRGYKLGEAEISAKHCNFLINHGAASAEDLINICYIVQQGVEKKCGIKLEFEIIFI